MGTWMHICLKWRILKGHICSLLVTTVHRIYEDYGPFFFFFAKMYNHWTKSLFFNILQSTGLLCIEVIKPIIYVYSEYMQGVQLRVHMTEQKSCYERMICQNSIICL